MWAARFIIIAALGATVLVGRSLLRDRARYQKLLENKVFNILLVICFQFLSYLLVILPTFGCPIRALNKLEYQGTVWIIVGGLFICAGLVMQIVTVLQRRVIGAQDVKDGVITSGLYRYLRHPAYTGIVLTCLGLAILLRNPDGLLTIPLIFMIYSIQAVSEERNDMLRRFPRKYQPYKQSVGTFGPMWLWVVVLVTVLVLVGCATTPKLTADERKEDIRFLARWARDYSPLVELTEKHKGNPSYEALLPQYLAYAEQAESNEEFYRVVRGYYDLICSAGHRYLVGASELKWASMAIMVGIIDIDINPWTSGEALYWPRLSDTLSRCGHPPFGVVLKDAQYLLEGDWQSDEITIPQGSQIAKVNGMDCSSYQEFLKEKTYLRYDVVSRDWIHKLIEERLLTYSEGPGFEGWQIDFLLPDGSARSAYVPKLKECPYQKKAREERTIEPKANCTCIELMEDVGYIKIKCFKLGQLSSVFHGIFKRDRRKIRTFLEQSTGKYKKLIIDIRSNPGGVPKYGYDNLMIPFLDEPVTYSEIAGIRRKYRDSLKKSVLKTLRTLCSTKKEHVVNVEEIDAPEGFDPNDWVFYELTRRIEPRHRYNFSGDVYVLTNGGTFSAADDFANAVKRTGFAKLVGQNTGGGHAAYIGPPAIKLPASEMIFRVETEITINPDGSVNEIVGTSPDLELPTADRPKSITKEELLKDEWIQYIINEL